MQIFEDRRALHQIPELQLHLPKTTAYVTAQLKKLSCSVFHPVDSSVCAYFDFGSKRTIAFRADMDALPVEEKTQLPFASRHPGAMHACGHDGHTAMLLELARYLDEKKSDKNILLIFQPGEEYPGGAEGLCNTGVLEEYHVEAIFGLHLWPELEKGKLFSRPGPLMSRTGMLDVEVHGKSAHVGKAEFAKDAMAAAVEFYSRAMDMERTMPPEVCRLLKFGHMESGTVRNVIAGQARLEGTLRTFDDTVFDQMERKLYQIAAEVTQETGCQVEVRMGSSYPVVDNAKELFDRVAQMVPLSIVESLAMVSEDFSWYQKRVPGLFCFLGVGDTPALHANTFDFDEQVLLEGVKFFKEMADKF